METFPIGSKLRKGQSVLTDHRVQSTPIIMYNQVDPAYKKSVRKVLKKKKKKQADPAQTKTNVKISKLKLKNLN